MEITNQKLRNQLIALADIDAVAEKIGKMGHDDFKKYAPWSEDSLTNLIAGLLENFVAYDRPQKKWFVWDGTIHSPVDDDASIVITKGIALELLESIREEFSKRHKLPALAEDASEDDKKSYNTALAENKRLLKPIGTLIARLNSNGGQKSLAEMLSRALPLYRKQQQLDDARYLSFKNGVLDTWQIQASTDMPELLPHNPELRMYRTLACNYNPKATAPQFMEFLQKSVDTSDEVTYLLKALGTALCNGFGMNSKTVISLQGITNSGKSMIVNLLTSSESGIAQSHAISVDGSAVFKFGDTNLKNQGRAHLADARIGFATEVTDSLDEKFILNYSGGDKYTVKELYKDPVMVQPQGMLVLVSNDGLKLDKTKSQLSRRISIVEFPHEFSASDPVYKEDRQLINKLVGEAEGIINILLHSYRLMLEEGLDRSEGMERKLAQETDIEDSLKAFIEESGLVAEVNEHTPKSKQAGIEALRGEFNKWCAMQGEKSAVLDRSSFRKRIARLGYDITDKNSGGGKVRVMGLELKFTS